jgi:hypothetical protein
MDRAPRGSKSIGSQIWNTGGYLTKRKWACRAESTEGNKQRISLIIICANTLVNNERGALYKMKKEYAR